MVLALLLSACGTMSSSLVDVGDAEARAFVQRGSDLQAEVDLLAKPLVMSGQTPGVVVGVLQADGKAGWKTQFFSYGRSSTSNDAVPDADTLFATGSLSKGFLGALTAILVEEGVFSWNETLGQLLPATVSLSADARRITIEQLATHTSGLPRQPMDLQTFVAFLRFLFDGDNFYRHLDHYETLAYLADFKAPRAQEPVYSNLAYGILGHVIELRTGQTLDQLLASKVLQPLQLKSTGYVPESLPGFGRRAHGHAGEQPKFMARGSQVPDWEFSGLMKGSAGIYSSARDLLSFAAAHLETPNLKPRPGLLDSLRVRFPRPHDAAAVAWFVDEFEGQRITYQVGFHAGYSCYLGLDRQRGLAVVVLQNAFNWTDEVGHRLLMRMARAKQLAAAQKLPVVALAGQSGI